MNLGSEEGIFGERHGCGVGVPKSYCLLGTLLDIWHLMWVGSGMWLDKNLLFLCRLPPHSPLGQGL